MPDRAWPWLQDVAASSIFCPSQSQVEAHIQWCNTFLHASGLVGCSTPPVWSFHLTAGFTIAVSRAVRWSSFSSGDALATWPNKYQWFDWIYQKKWLGIALVGAYCSFFCVLLLFSRKLQSSFLEICILTTPQFLSFYFYFVKFNFYTFRIQINLN